MSFLIKKTYIKHIIEINSFIMGFKIIYLCSVIYVVKVNDFESQNTVSHLLKKNAFAIQ